MTPIKVSIHRREQLSTEIVEEAGDSYMRLLFPSFDLESPRCTVADDLASLNGRYKC